MSQSVDCQAACFVLFLPCCPAFWLVHCLLDSLYSEETKGVKIQLLILLLGWQLSCKVSWVK